MPEIRVSCRPLGDTEAKSCCHPWLLLTVGLCAEFGVSAVTDLFPDHRPGSGVMQPPRRVASREPSVDLAARKSDAAWSEPNRLGAYAAGFPEPVKGRRRKVELVEEVTKRHQVRLD